MPARFTPEERFEYLKQFGSHCMAYSTLQPGMEYFDLPAVGYLAYMTHGRTRFVLGEPICAEADSPRLMDEALRDHCDTCFVQIQKPTAEWLFSAHGFRLTQMGIETAIHLPSFQLSGRGKQVVRSSRNQARNSGVVIKEVPAAEADWAVLQQVSSSWLKTRKSGRHEMAFLVRPLSKPHSKDVRSFLASRDGQIVGFILFDPMFNDRKISGYFADTSRSNTAFRRGLYYAILVDAIERFRSEGMEWLSLGLSPLSPSVRQPVNSSRAFDAFLRFLFRFGNWRYNFKGIAFTKSRFDGRERPVYTAHRSRIPVLETFAIFRLSHVI